ncbi:16102_t:CDS:2, partial [Entrophospora sp. SA101]
MGRIHKEYYSANARYLSDEAIQEIKESMGKVPDAVNVMASKYQISYYRVLDYMENRERKQQMIYPQSSKIRKKVGGISEAKKETISSSLPNISQDSEDVLDLYNRSQKEQKK